MKTDMGGVCINRRKVMAKNDNVTNSALKVKRGIGKTLLTYLLPIILIGIVCIIVFIS